MGIEAAAYIPDKVTGFSENIPVRMGELRAIVGVGKLVKRIGFSVIVSHASPNPPHPALKSPFGFANDCQIEQGRHESEDKN